VGIISSKLSGTNVSSWVYSSFTPANEGGKNHSIYDPSKSHTSKILPGETFNTTYGDGSSVSGTVYTDIVEFGGVSANTAVDTATYVSASFYTDGAIDGFLGMGFDNGNKGKIS
jgi:hypothetical protein